MYRHSAQVNCLAKPSLPSPESTSDPDFELVEALDWKRRQLDEEIARFKAVKDREFRDFERDLRTRSKRKRAQGSSAASETSPSGKQSGVPASTASVLNLLASAHNASGNGWFHQKSKKGADNVVGEKITRPAPLSKPTLSLDRLNITGETTPPTSVLGTPPTPPALTKSFNRSPSAPSTTLTPPRSNPTNPGPPTPLSERWDSFAGVFIPAYLPLLESREHTPAPQSPQPRGLQQEAEKNQLDSINADAKRDAEQQTTKSQSLPQQPVSPTVVATKRTHSTPQLPSTSLPSALRNSNGKSSSDGSSAVRKRKHVTFQLADLAIVNPSSSYEELPSPTPRHEIGRSDETSITVRVTEDPMHSEVVLLDSAGRDGSPEKKKPGKKTRKENGTLSPRDTTQRKGRLRSPAISPLPSPSPSPTIDGRKALPDDSGFSGGLAASADGGSGVGFFELDEELASPAFTEDRSFEFNKVESQDKVDEDLILDEKKINQITLDGELQVGSFAAGSVPIDIVRHPTGSWIGSYGH